VGCQSLSPDSSHAYGEAMDERRAEDQPIETDAPTGGDETTEEQLQADNPAEEDMLKALGPGAPSA